MRLLAHRGLWLERDQRNRPESLAAALAAGYGIETDLRDTLGRLVIAHDPVSGPAQPLADLLPQAGNRPLALNIKADGLAPLLQPLLAAHLHLDYFCFDMSVPEMLVYRRLGLRYFTRESEHETSPALYDDAAGVWLDMFHRDWASAAHIRAHLDRGKSVALVSPELHQRNHLPFWETLRASALARAPGLMLCTDHPGAAHDFFHD